MESREDAATNAPEHEISVSISEIIDRVEPATEGIANCQSEMPARTSEDETNESCNAPSRTLVTALEAAISEAAALIRDAEALLVLAGAGMSVDSGLPDYR